MASGRLIEIARYPIQDSLLDVASPIDGCLIWQRALDSGGYGSLRSKGKTYRAHEVAWFLSGQERPAGYTLHHTCGNRACVLVAHMVCISRAEHWEITKAEDPEFWVKQRAAVRTALRHELCQRGHNNWYEKPSGGRQCIECQNEWRREQRRKRRQQS